MVVIGEKFPEVEVKTTHGVIKLPDYFAEQGKWFILFSHPADFTPGLYDRVLCHAEEG